MTDDGFLRLDRELIEAAQKTEYNTYDELVQAYNTMSDENRKRRSLWLAGGITLIIMKVIKTVFVKSTYMLT